jgi:hypothetical protein
VGCWLGGQVYSQTVFFQDQLAFDDLASGTFEFGSQATAVASTAGASAQSGTGGSRRLRAAASSIHEYPQVLQRDGGVYRRKHAGWCMKQ